MQKISLIVILLLYFFLTGCKSNNEIEIIPRPQIIQSGKGFFTLDEKTEIILGTKNLKVNKIVANLKKQIENNTKIKFLQDKKHTNKIIFIIDEKLSLKKEGYILNVEENKIELKGKDEAGVFYALQSLYQLMKPSLFSSGEKITLPVKIPFTQITDEPKFFYRGGMLDVSRHFFSKEFVKKFIDILAFHKLNKFHWHLTDDQGWRIEIKKYPRLTLFGSIRKETEGNGIEHKGYYTQRDIKEIIEYAESKFIEVIPEIEMPGHAVAALASYPNLSCTGNVKNVSTRFGIHEDIYCAGNEQTFVFLENVLDEVVKLFPSKYIHVGGDEAPKMRWKKCKKCKALMKKENLKNEEELQSYFIKRIEKYLASKNKQLIGWDEILEEGLSKSATVMSWRGTGGGIEAAQKGNQVIMAPNTYFYFDYYQAKNNEPYAIGGFLPIEKVYSYNPIPKELKENDVKNIIGVEAELWTEHIVTEKYAEYMLLPRLSAFAEVAWTEYKNKNYSDFEKRMIKQYSNYGVFKWNYRVPTPIGIESEKIICQPASIKIKSPLKDASIKYTLDGTEPDKNSKTYREPIYIDKSMLVKTATYMPDGKVGRAVVSSVSLIDTNLNGVVYKYYEGTWNKLPNFARIKSIDSGRINSFEMQSIERREDAYAILFNSYLNIEEEDDYIFTLISDDGSKLLINDKLIIDNDGSHPKQTRKSKINLTKGLHKIELQYFEDCEGEALELYIESSKIHKQKIPAHKLFLEKN